MRSPSAGTVEEPHSAHFRRGRSGRHPDGDRLVEGLRMSRTGDTPSYHRPVMVDEVVGLLGEVPPGLAVDATVGGGGHAAALLAAHPGLSLVGIDRDAEAVEVATAALAGFGERATVLRARFDRLDEVVGSREGQPVTAVLFDLGVSSAQFDRPERGFSYRHDAPLDMRMSRDDELTAADVVNTFPVDRLARMFADSGEGRLAGRIARAVVAARPVLSTARLAEVVRDAIPAPARRRGGHPAKRVFQAVRMAVNDELDLLPGALDAAIAALAPGGRLVVLAYHSGEDRIVKERMMAAESGGCECPPGLPCRCGAQPSGRRLSRGAVKASPTEVAANPRAASARLRALERLEPPPGPAPADGRS